ncbi:MAG TPA: hypothetical protein VFH36_06305 [Acidimicrobiales bacterium]|nr:hypothetical protein [Acidimicrobiales bacterium]
MDVHIRVDLDDEGPVVVKSANGAAVERLARERRLLERAAHPGVVSLADTPDGDPAELRTRYAGEPISRWTGSLRAVAGLGAAVASTLADLHDLGVVHGRLDATHILIGHDGRPRLCGLAQPGGATAADDVAALGAALDPLVERTPADRRGLQRWRGRAGGERRALRQVIERATDAVPTRRLSARAMADALLAAVPGARLPAPTPGPGASRAGGVPRRPPGPTAGAGRRDEPDTLDRIWAFGGDETDDERWAAALGTGPPDLPTDAGRDDTTQLPMAEIDTPAWPTTPVEHDTAVLPRPIGTADVLDDPGPDVDGSAPAPDESRDPRRRSDARPVDHPTDGAGPDHDSADARPPDQQHAGSPRPHDQPTDAWPTGEHVEGGRADDQLTRDHTPAAGRVTPGRRPPGAAPAPRAGRRRRRLAAAGAAVVAVALAAAGATVIGSGGDADAPRPGPSGRNDSPDGAGPAADVDGDGCPEPLVVEGGTVDAGVARWSLGAPGDLVAVGDWDCDGEASAALLRPSTGDVFVFSAWADAGEPVTVSSTQRVDGGVGIRAEAGDRRCDRLVVDLARGGSAIVEVGR